MSNLLFKTKAVHIATLGEYLTQVRTKLNLDIKTVSMLTQIKTNYLEALEKGDYKRLPVEVYIKGFLKSLADLYHIKEEVLIEQFEKEHGFEPKIQTKIKSAKLPISLTPTTIVIATSVIIGLSALVYVGSQVRSVLAPPLLELNDPASDGTVSGNSLVVAGRAEIGADVTINSQSVLTDKNGVFNENLILSNGLNIIEIRAKNKFGKENKIIRTINADVSQTAASVQNLPVNVTIQVGPESSWIYLEVDGVVVQRGTMLPGSSKTVSAKEEVLLTSANAGSTSVIYNGKDLGKLGRAGEVVRNVEFSSTLVQ
ncbi:MAG: DUF4115 domain-containing protein [Candidatus Doudnabacteria bacterium]|nr:DUF4115 domain-containing protein [Candidatus Doudnabacteria bacterium]